MGPPLVHGRSHGKGRPKLPRAGFLLGGMQVVHGQDAKLPEAGRKLPGQDVSCHGQDAWVGPKVVQPAF